MKIEKTDHKSGLGIYAKSISVQTKEQWEEAKRIAKEMIDWLDAENGSFVGTHERAFAMAHPQVAPIEQPFKLFVVDKDLVLPEKRDKDSKHTLENSYFESQAIFNVEILETPAKVKRKVPKRNVVRDEKNKMQVHVEMVVEEKEISNLIAVPEACMSFPHRKAKNVDRYYEIKVRYDYLDKKGKVKTFEGWVSNIKAHIIQHEADHFNAENIYHSN